MLTSVRRLLAEATSLEWASRHFNRFLAEEINEPLLKLIVQPIYFPMSGDILHKAISMMQDKKVKKETFF